MRDTAPRNFVGDRAGPLDNEPQPTLNRCGDHHHGSEQIHLVEFPTPDQVVNLAIGRLQDDTPDWKSGSLDLSSWARTLRGWIDELWPTFIPTHLGDRTIRPPPLLLTFRR